MNPQHKQTLTFQSCLFSFNFTKYISLLSFHVHISCSSQSVVNLPRFQDSSTFSHHWCSVDATAFARFTTSSGLHSCIATSSAHTHTQKPAFNDKAALARFQHCTRLTRVSMQAYARAHASKRPRRSFSSCYIVNTLTEVVNTESRVPI